MTTPLGTVDQVIREVEFVRERWDSPYILFSDDNFVVDRARTRELLTRMAGPRGERARRRARRRVAPGG